MEPTTAPVLKPKLPSTMKLLSESYEIVKKKASFYLTLSAIPMVISGVGSILLSMNPESSSSFTTFWILTLASAILSIIISVGLIKGLHQPEYADVKQAFRDGASLFFPLLWVGILVAIVTALGMIALVLPGIYLAIALSFYSYTLVLEGKRGWESADRSRTLVKGYWWAVFGRILLFGIVVGLAVVVATGLAGLAGPMVMNIVNMLVSILLVPYSVAFSYLVYQGLVSMKGSTSQTA